MTQDEYLAQSLIALRRNEKSAEDDTKALLLLLLWRFRQSLLASLPDTGIGRSVVAAELLRAFTLELTAYSNQFLNVLLPVLERVDQEHPGRAAAYAGFTATLRDYAPRTGQQLLEQTRSSGQTLATLFTPVRGTTISPYVRAQLNAIKGRLDTAIMRGDPTIEIARGVIAQRTRRGFIQPINARGTLYSQLRNRDTALIANAIWDVSAYSERAIFERQQRRTARTDAPFAPRGWRWYATLDPATCPICRPLHGRTSDRFTGFPYIPPVHPRCRCRILPA